MVYVVVGLLVQELESALADRAQLDAIRAVLATAHTANVRMGAQLVANTALKLDLQRQVSFLKKDLVAGRNEID